MALIAKSIEFTPLARLQLQAVIDYTIKEFGSKSAEKFVFATERRLRNIADGKIVYRYFYKTKQIRYFIAHRKKLYSIPGAKKIHSHRRYIRR
jgi:hypothetical protein